jgi:hypothetical protein
LFFDAVAASHYFRHESNVVQRPEAAEGVWVCKKKKKVENVGTAFVYKTGFEPASANTLVPKTSPLDLSGTCTIAV